MYYKDMFIHDDVDDRKFKYDNTDYKRFICETCKSMCTDKKILKDYSTKYDYVICFKTVKCRGNYMCKHIRLKTADDLNIVGFVDYKELIPQFNYYKAQLKSSLFFITKKNFFLKFVKKDDEYIYYRVGFFFGRYNVVLNENLNFYIRINKEGKDEVLDLDKKVDPFEIIVDNFINRNEVKNDIKDLDLFDKSLCQEEADNLFDKNIKNYNKNYNIDKFICEVCNDLCKHGYLYVNRSKKNCVYLETIKCRNCNRFLRLLSKDLDHLNVAALKNFSDLKIH